MLKAASVAPRFVFSWFKVVADSLFNPHSLPWLRGQRECRKGTKAAVEWARAADL